MNQSTSPRAENRKQRMRLTPRALKSATNPSTIGGWLVVMLLSALACLWLQTPSVLEAFAGSSAIASSPAIKSGYYGQAGIVLSCCSDAGQRESMAAWEVKIVQGREYLVTVALDNQGLKDVSPVVVDLAGKGYDNMEQEFHLVLPAGSTGNTERRILNSGVPPEQVWLRIFHDSSAPIVVKHLSIRELSRAYRVSLIAAFLAFGLSLTGFGVAVMAWVRSKGITAAARIGSTSAWVALAAVSLLVATLANSMLGPPIVFADEFSYFAATSAVGGGETASPGQDLPNRLFFAIYSLVSHSQAPFAMARSLNVLALGVGILVLFVAARALGDLAKGLVVALAYSLGTLATYTAYFMPDALFGSVFMAACVGLALALAKGDALAAMIAGVACASLTFIKPHGWPVAAVFLAYTFVFAWRATPAAAAYAWRTLGRAFAAFTLTWLVLQILLPDVARRSNFLGTTYGGLMARFADTAIDFQRYSNVALLFGTHLIVLGCLLAPAFAFGLSAAARPRLDQLSTRDRIGHVIAGLSAASLLALIAMTSFFTVSVEGLGSYEVVNRLHGRYFTFALPLLVLAAVATDGAEQFVRKNFRFMVALWAVACVLAIVLLPRFVWSFVDSPELFFGWHAPKATFAFFGVLGVATATLLRRSPRMVNTVVLGVYALSVLVSGGFVRYLQISIMELPEHRAGQFASAMAAEYHEPLLLVGESRTVSLYRVAAYLPMQSRFVTRANLEQEIDRSLATGAIVVGEKDYIGDLVGVVPRAEFGLFTVGVVEQKSSGQVARSDKGPGQPFDPLTISFAAPGADSVRVSGLHPAESWGAWSSESQISITLPRAVTGRVHVILRAHALAANVGRSLSMRIGSKSRNFALQATPTTVDLVFDLDAPERVLVIKGYQQLSPEEAKLSSESRRLGIALWSVRLS